MGHGSQKMPSVLGALTFSRRCTACALHGHIVHIECNAHAMKPRKPSQGGREETTLHLCRRHKGLHILGRWWPWLSTIYCGVSVLEDGGSLPGT